MGNGPFQPFVNVSIGGCRKMEFFTNYQKATETPAKTVQVQNGAMYTMNTGCQKYFRHRVPTTGIQFQGQKHGRLLLRHL